MFYDNNARNIKGRIVKRTGKGIMDVFVILHQMVQLFILLGLGYFLYKVKVIDDDFNKNLTKFVLNCTLPLMILASVLEQPAEREYLTVAKVFGISVAIYIILPLLAFVLVKVLRMPKDQQGMYMMMLTYGNVGFMGFPILDAVYGSIGVFYAAMLNIVFNVSAFSAGVIMVNYGAEGGSSSKIQLKSIFSPGIIISLLSIAIYFTGIIFPQDIVSACSAAGGLTSPLAMIIIGATLATMDVKSVFDDWRIYLFTLVKQIILPIIMWLIFRVVIKDEMILGICTILMMMPTANICVMLAKLHNRNEKLAAKGIFITTLFAMVSVPLLMFFIA